MTASNPSVRTSAFPLRAGGHPHMALLVDRQHHGVRRRIDVQPDDVLDLGRELGIARELEGTDLIRWTELTLSPLAAAIARPVQRVASPGGSPRVNATTCSTTAMGSGVLPGGRLLSRSSPSTPSSMNRSCHRHTVALAQPTWRMIASVPTPSALSSTIRARSRCFWGRLRSATIASSRARSSAATSISIPVRIPAQYHIVIPDGTFMIASLH
jgi:hypothetical protein